MDHKRSTTEEERQGRPSIAPLLARLERLDSLIKSVEKRQNLAATAAAATPSDDDDKEGRRCSVPLDSAVEEARKKGSVLDRLSSIERRLTQLSIQIESSNNNASNTTSTLGSPSTRLGSSDNKYSLPFPSLDEKLEDHKRSRSTINSKQKYATDVSSTGRDEDVDKKEDVVSNNNMRSSKNKSKARNSSWCKRLLGC